MGKPSIYSKTRRELRRDLALAGRIAKPEIEVAALPESIGPEENSSKITPESGEETG